MGTPEALHGNIDREAMRSLEPWRHELITRLDDKLFLADEAFALTRHDSRMSELQMASIKQELFEEIRRYVQIESCIVPGGPESGDRVEASGRLFWHRYDYHRQAHTTELLPDGYIVTGHYDGCDVLPYIDPYYLQGSDELAQTEHPVTRAIGVHMMLTVPAIVSRSGDDAELLMDVDRVYIPLHYPTAQFHTRSQPE